MLLALPAASLAAVWTDADTLRGSQAASEFGNWVAGVGDLDGDGFPDLAIGAHYFTIGTDTAAGAVFLYGGGLPPGSPPMLGLYGISSNEHFGECFAGGHDIDGDGHPDLVVGAPLRDTGPLRATGAVDIFRGGPGLGAAPWASLHGEAADDWFGQSVAIGDLDGDGKAEIIVGAPYNDRHGSAAGAVFIYRGGTQPPAAPWKILVGEAANDQFGWSVAYAGDVDGDGYGDIVVGARLHSVIGKIAAGRVYLFRGGPAMDTVAAGFWNGEAANDWFGNSVSGPGDVDGGGRADILVGAPYNDRNGSAAGAAYLFRGELPAGSAPAAIYTGESANAQFGWAVGAAGDVTGDGHPDMLAGARFQASGTLSAAGRAYLFAGGTPLATTPFATMDGEAANDWLGQSVGGAPGFFNATRSAALVGGPLNDAAGANAGRAYAAGIRPTLAVTPPGPSRAALRAWPVPARGPVRFTLTLPDPEPVEVAVSDVAGREVRRWSATVGSSQMLTGQWDGLDLRGQPASAGLYFMRVLGRGPHGGTAPLASTRLVLVR